MYVVIDGTKLKGIIKMTAGSDSSWVTKCDKTLLQSGFWLFSVLYVPNSFLSFLEKKNKDFLKLNSSFCHTFVLQMAQTELPDFA